jgi:putative ABC transport system ATP-binding protein
VSVLVAEDVTKTFQEGKRTVPVLNGVSLEARRGEVVILEGPSGSGKTTFLSIAGCLLAPTSGRLAIDGREIDPSRPEELPEVRRRSIGFVFQQFNLIPSLTALENVLLGLNVRGRRGRAATEEARAALAAVDLGDRTGALPGDLSGGQKQRVAIARALAGDAPLILADEPTANLDSSAGAQVLELFRKLAKRESRALVIVTHDPRVRVIADRVLAMRDGRVVDERVDLAWCVPGRRRSVQELVVATRGWSPEEHRERHKGPFLLGVEHVYAVPDRSSGASARIGRGGGNEIVVFHPGVEERHATIERRSDRWEIVAEGATRVGGRPLARGERSVLAPGMAIDLGAGDLGGGDPGERLVFGGPDELHGHLELARRCLARMGRSAIAHDLGHAFLALSGECGAEPRKLERSPA